MRVQIEELKTLIQKKLSVKFNPDEVERITGAILFAEIAGKKTHGLLRLLPNRFGPLDEKKEAELVVQRISDFSSKITGLGYPGMLLSSLAVDQVLGLARDKGLGIVSYIGNRSTSGCLSYYVKQVAEEGFLCFMMSNCAPLVAPKGITKRVLGTNPFAVAIPSADKKDPLIVDFGTSSISFGELAVLFEKKLKLPKGSGLDTLGDETDEPLSVMKGGALLPFGGHKGFGISLAIELLCGPLIGASFSGLHESRAWGNIIVAVNPSVLGGNLSDCEELYSNIMLSQKEGAGFRFPGTQTQKKYKEVLASAEVEVVDEIYKQILDSGA